MAKLKPSEFRLLLVFGIVAFILVNFYGYTWLRKKHNDINNEQVDLEAQVMQAENYALQEEDSLRKEAWLAKRVPVYRTEDEMKTFLIKFVRQKAAEHGVEAELHSQEPVGDGPFMRSRLEVKQISGSIDTLVQWIYSLLDPEQFRTITSLELKAKPKDPTTLFCELVIEQWWNPDSPTIAANSDVLPVEPAEGGVTPAPSAPAGLPPGAVVPNGAIQPPAGGKPQAAKPVIAPPKPKASTNEQI